MLAKIQCICYPERFKYMKVEHEIEVRFRDIDSMGHVNNAVYLSYFEQARMAWFKKLVGSEWNWIDAGILVARHEIDYKSPVSLNDNITISTWCESMGTSSLVMAYEIIKDQGIKFAEEHWEEELYSWCEHVSCTYHELMEMGEGEEYYSYFRALRKREL